MRHLSYKTYFDKVYGCFLGKCIGGTAGGPAEGRKELLDYPLHEPLLHIALPNDDLDLQILWLELLEAKGPGFTARDMAEEFHDKVPYGPGEYGYFMKNHGHGIYPPFSGRYNNRYYQNGMGCPIRAEIWACLFPGMPSLAAPYVEMDGSLDHLSDSIDAEQFLVTAEAEAFFTTGHDLTAIRHCIETGLTALKRDTKIDRVLRETLRLYDAGHPWQYTRGMILRGWGHSDCTNLYQNMGFILLTLLYGGGDMRETIRLGLACGYDTDCICASAASLLGMLRGADILLNQDGMTDTGLKIAIGTQRRDGSIESLAHDVCAAGMAMADVFAEKGAVMIDDKPVYRPLPVTPAPSFVVTAEYADAPVLVCEKNTCLSLKFTGTAVCGKIHVEIQAPEGTVIHPDSMDFHLNPDETAISVSVTASIAADAEILQQKNIFVVTAQTENGAFSDTFGLAGGAVWFHYGPFLQNNRDLSMVPPEKGYGSYLTPKEGEYWHDVLRDYHLSSFADINCDYVPETLPFTRIEEDGTAFRTPERICTTEDYFTLSAIQGYEGPHTDYLIQTLISPEERTVELAIGHTAPFKLWINGAYIGGSEKSAWWTLENMHFTVTLKKGENTVILKCAQVAQDAGYSIIPRILNGGMRQWEDMATALRLTK